MNRLTLIIVFFLINNILFSKITIANAQDIDNEVSMATNLEYKHGIINRIGYVFETVKCKYLHGDEKEECDMEIPKKYKVDENVNIDLKTENGIDIGDINVNKDGEVEVDFKSGKGISTDIEI